MKKNLFSKLHIIGCSLILLTSFLGFGVYSCQKASDKSIERQGSNTSINTQEVEVIVNQQLEELKVHLPIQLDEGTITAVSRSEHSVVVSYVLPEEVFMSYYEMPIAQREDDKMSFRKILQVAGLEPLLENCDSANVSVILNVIGITSGEQFTFNLSE